MICSRDEARIQAAAEQIRKDTGAKVEALVADVSNAAEAERLVGCGGVGLRRPRDPRAQRRRPAGGRSSAR